RVSRLSFETRVFDVSHHAHDLMTLRVRHVQPEAPSEWFLIRKVLPRKYLIDQRDRWRLARVLRREDPSAHQLNLHRLEIVSIDRVLNAVRFLPLRGWWLSVDDERRKICSFKRQAVRHGDRVNSRQRFDARL